MKLLMTLLWERVVPLRSCWLMFAAVTNPAMSVTACNLTIFLITAGHCSIPFAARVELHIKDNVWQQQLVNVYFSPLFSSACT